MTIHMNIGKAKANLSGLVAAAKRGEDVILDKAGVPQVRIVALEVANLAERKRMAAQRVANIGYLKHLVSEKDIIVPPSMSDLEIDARERRICDSGV